MCSREFGFFSCHTFKVRKRKIQAEDLPEYTAKKDSQRCNTPKTSLWSN